MKKTRIQFLSEGFHEILTSEEVQGLVMESSQAIANKANQSLEAEGFRASTFVGNYGGGRHIGVVNASTYEAKQEEATNKVLSRAVW